LKERNPFPVGGRYASYALGVLVLVYLFNYLDRQAIAILAEDIKADLGLSDAQIGFLYGTSFAVFYALFGIPLGRAADAGRRRSLISLGVAFWSVLTALSGLAGNFTQLALARVGVGIGEASATPAAFSYLSDAFPPRRRATVLGLYSGGLYLGIGLSLWLAGTIVERWDGAWGEGGAPFGLHGWQAAFLLIGTPGLLLALWVRSLREPRRGQADGIPSGGNERPLPVFWRELSAVIPPFSFVRLWLSGAGRFPLRINLAAAVLLAGGAWVLCRTVGSPAQWIALGIGVHAAFTWAQGLRLRDPAAAALFFRTPSLRNAALAFSLLAFAGTGFSAWTPTFFRRLHGVEPSRAGLVLGITAAAAGLAGILAGGMLADRLRKRTPAGRLWVGILAGLAPIPFALGMLFVPSTNLAFALNVPFSFLGAMWIGAGASTVQDLVLPRMRATASAAYLLVMTFLGLAMGPFFIGRVSDALGDLRVAMLLALPVNLLAAALAWRAARTLAGDEATLLERARAAGETGLDAPTRAPA